MPTRRRSLCTGALLLVGACAHTYYQFRPLGQEAEALDTAALRLAAAAEARDGSIVEEDVDLEGRRALFEVAMHVARTKADAGPQLDSLVYLYAMIAVPLPYVGENETPPLEQLTAHLGDISKKFEAELAPVLPEAVDGGTGSAIGDLAAGIRTRAQETSRDHVLRLLTGAFPDELTACHPVRKVSYRASVLEHLEGEPAGRSYREWRKHVLAVHLYLVRCAERDGLAIFDEYEDRPRPGLPAWRFFTHNESSRIEAQIDRALESQ
jgi:hypothetical protein